mgnify:CR=1 FL=1
MCWAPGSSVTTPSAKITPTAASTGITLAMLVTTTQLAYPTAACPTAPATGASNLVISAALVAATVVYAI